MPSYVNKAYRCPTGFWKVIAGLTSWYVFLSSACPNCNALKTAPALGVIVLTKVASTTRGICGVGVTVGVSVSDGVSVMVGVGVIVGVCVTVGISVEVAVGVSVTVGG
jgi:hypothetical protein